MNINKIDDKALRKYLIGSISEKRKEAVELWLMSNKESCDLLDAAEDDLIDDFLAGKLNSCEARQFEKHFLISPERERKLQFGRTLKRYIERADAEDRPVLRPIPIWQKTMGPFSNRLVNAYGMAAMVAVLFIGALMSYLRIADLGKDLHDAEAQLSNVQQEYKELEGRLGTSQSLSRRLQSQFQRFEQAVTDWMEAPVPQTLLAQNLQPGVPRSSNNIPTVPISSSIRLIKFSLALLENNYDSYHVTLFDAEGRELWVVDGIKATTTSKGEFVAMTIPGNLFTAGEYYLDLAGMSDSQRRENISNFYFRSVIR